MRRRSAEAIEIRGSVEGNPNRASVPCDAAWSYSYNARPLAEMAANSSAVIGGALLAVAIGVPKRAMAMNKLK